MVDRRHISNAVELDEWLSSRTPEDFTEAHAAVGQVFRDQLEAATRDLKGRAEEVAGKPAYLVGTTDMNDWLRLGMLDAFLTWALKKGDTCEHTPDMRYPQPVWAAAWKPGLVVCELCTELLSVAGTPSDKTCDGCGHLCDGLPDDPVYPVSLLNGGFGYLAAACQDCYADLPKPETT